METLVGDEHCPAEFAFDSDGRLWGFQVQGEGHIDPPNGPILPKLPYLVKDVAATPGRIWVKLMELRSGDYGLGFWRTDTAEYHPVFDSSDPGDPALLEYGHGTLWVAGRGAFALPDLSLKQKVWYPPAA